MPKPTFLICWGDFGRLRRNAVLWKHDLQYLHALRLYIFLNTFVT